VSSRPAPPILVPGPCGDIAMSPVTLSGYPLRSAARLTSKDGWFSTTTVPCLEESRTANHQHVLVGERTGTSALYLRLGVRGSLASLRASGASLKAPPTCSQSANQLSVASHPALPQHTPTLVKPRN